MCKWAVLGGAAGPDVVATLALEPVVAARQRWFEFLLTRVRKAGFQWLWTSPVT